MYTDYRLVFLFDNYKYFSSLSLNPEQNVVLQLCGYRKQIWKKNRNRLNSTLIPNLHNNEQWTVKSV